MPESCHVQPGPNSKFAGNQAQLFGHARCAAGRRMEDLAAIFVVVSSVGISIGLSRLAVGEMFRLVRTDAQKRSAKPPNA